MAKDILYQAAAAGVALLESWAITTIPAGQIYPGVRHGTVTQQQAKEQTLRKTPRVEVIARKADPQVPNFRGLWTVQLVFNVISNSQDTTDEEHQARVEEVLTPLLSDTVARDMTYAQSYFFVPVILPGSRDQAVEDKLWIDSQVLELREACLTKFL